MFRIALCVVVALASGARADEWVTPTPRTITSPNNKLQAVISPSPAGAKSHATAAIGPPKGKVKTLTLVDEWMPVDAILFDDGTLLTLDHWHSLGDGKVATLYEASGKIRWAKTLEQLVGKQLVEAAPHSVSSIWWRKTPLEWALAPDGKTGLITLFDENQLQLTLADGATALVAVQTLPDVPEKLVNRARALAKEDRKANEVFALLDRALAKDADHFEALSLYVDLLQRANDHARAIALFDRFSPRWKTKDGYAIANACVAWAESLTALKRLAEAEQRLRQGVAAAPTYPNPTVALAKLLAGAKRGKDADAAIDEFVSRLMKAPSLDTYGLTTVADFYKQRKEHAKAVALYLKGYKQDQVTNQFLYETLAELYEEMGNDAEAIRIDEQLLAYFQKMGSAFDMYTKRTREALARLRAKTKPRKQPKE